jgi:hypothetical protein
MRIWRWLLGLKGEVFEMGCIECSGVTGMIYPGRFEIWMI